MSSCTHSCAIVWARGMHLMLIHTDGLRCVASAYFLSPSNFLDRENCPHASATVTGYICLQYVAREPARTDRGFRKPVMIRSFQLFSMGVSGFLCNAPTHISRQLQLHHRRVLHPRLLPYSSNVAFDEHALSFIELARHITQRRIIF